MFQTLTFYHSFMRWLVLISLINALYFAYKGYRNQSQFSKAHNAIRHITATIAHIQLILGILIYTQSPIIKYFRQNFNEAIQHPDITFFALIHMLLMLTAIALITIGSAIAKRKTLDQHKFKTILLWYSLALLLIIIAIPWPFSPLANRPYFR